MSPVTAMTGTDAPAPAIETTGTVGGKMTGIDLAETMTGTVLVETIANETGLAIMTTNGAAVGTEMSARSADAIGTGTTTGNVTTIVGRTTVIVIAIESGRRTGTAAVTASGTTLDADRGQHLSACLLYVQPINHLAHTDSSTWAP
jgi:hypothetical protein